MSYLQIRDAQEHLDRGGWSEEHIETVEGHIDYLLYQAGY